VAAQEWGGQVWWAAPRNDPAGIPDTSRAVAIIADYSAKPQALALITPSPRPFPRFLGLAALAAAILLGGGCATVDTYVPTLRTFGVYMLDINQGNYLSQDMVDKLKVGQTKVQVRQLLGTPLVVSVFRDNRWDYVYEFTRQGLVREHRTFTVYFVDDKLARWEGDEMPVSVAELNKAATAITVGESTWSDPRSWWEKIVDVFKK
jgi:outer membrane protein assembly factor BamE (lipoprotein component of BamABCDE complex)